MTFMNRTFSFKLANELGGTTLDAAELIADQWASRTVTKSKNIFIFDDPTVPALNSLFDLYNSKEDG